MISVLANELSRELNTFPGIIITLTQDGIRFRRKRKQRALEVSWQKIFGAAAMINQNESILLEACRVALQEIGCVDGEFEDKLQESQNDS